MKVSGSQALVKSLEQEGVEVLFGIPGGVVLPLFDALLDSSIRRILTRHEQGAAHAAEGYAQVTGKVGVCVATSGPGATNLVTGIANAYMDSTPLVAVTGQVPTHAIGTDAFQEADITGITLPVTKHNYLVTHAADIPRVIKEAFHIASTGRPGPVLVDVPKDILAAEMTWWYPDGVDLPGYRPNLKPHRKQVREAAALIRRAHRPVLYVGGGVSRARASEELKALAKMTGMPVVTTLTARGMFPDDDPMALGMPGMHGTYAAVTAMQKSDLLVAIGVRFDDRTTGRLSAFAKGAAVIHADIDPAEIGKNRAADVPIVGDARAVLAELVSVLGKEAESHPPADIGPWQEQVLRWKDEYPCRYTQEVGGLLKPQYVIQKIGEAVGEDAVIVTGVGQHQMWSSQFLRFNRAHSWVTSGGLGTMGFGLPAAMGAKVGRPDAVVFAIDGDGSIQMTSQELATCTVEHIPIKVAVINNSHLGMVRQWQELFYKKRFSSSYLPPDVPDYVKLAEAYGGVGLRVDSAEGVEPAIARALEVQDVPCIIDFRVDPEEMVYPMVPVGHANDDIVLGPEYDAGEDQEGEE
ncbi:MAG: acetolactate synthase large subunit [Actinomycetota bacterium]